MPTSYLVYCKPANASVNLDIHDIDNEPLDHWASDQFEKLQPDDDIWIVTIEDGLIYLIGHMPVDAVLPEQETIKFLGRDNIYSAKHHAVCAKEFAEPMIVIDINKIASQLRFESKKDRLIFEDDGTLAAQQLQSIRRLTEDSANLLKSVWYEPEAEKKDSQEDALKTGAEDEAVLQTLAAFQPDAELRREVEQAAVAFVTAALQKDGWQVTSVETDRCGYDLLCTKGQEERHVEVKGASGETSSFFITAQELRCALQNSAFELWAVTHVLSDTPSIRRYTGRDFESSFELQPLLYRALPTP